MTQKFTRNKTKTSRGSIAQTRFTSITGSLSISTSMPSPWTDAPTSSEGEEIMSLAITPTSSTSTLIIHVSCNAGLLDGDKVAALFIDDDVNAVAASAFRPRGPDNHQSSGPIGFIYKMTSGTTSTLTFKVRVGCVTAGTMFLNAGLNSVAGNDLGGVIPSSMMIYEIRG